MTLEASNYKIEQAGDGQYEAIVTMPNRTKQSKVFLDHDDAEAWALEQLNSDEVESDESTEQTRDSAADTTSDEGTSSKG